MSIDPLVLQAEATAEAGNALATFLLGKDGPSAIAGLTNLAAILPKIPIGGVSPFQLGAVSAQLNAINAKATAANASQQLISQIGSVIALVSNSEAAASGGNITVQQALLVAAAQNVSNGISNALGFYAGAQSVTNPPPPASAPATA
jgi:hypothetical protein